jgi:hypothetical protein
MPRQRAIGYGLVAGAYELTVDPDDCTAGNVRAINHVLMSLKK